MTSFVHDGAAIAPRKRDVCTGEEHTHTGKRLRDVTATMVAIVLLLIALVGGLLMRLLWGLSHIQIESRSVVEVLRSIF